MSARHEATHTPVRIQWNFKNEEDELQDQHSIYGIWASEREERKRLMGCESNTNSVRNKTRHDKITMSCRSRERPVRGRGTFIGTIKTTQGQLGGAKKFGSVRGRGLCICSALEKQPTATGTLVFGTNTQVTRTTNPNLFGNLLVVAKGNTAQQFGDNVGVHVRRGTSILKVTLAEALRVSGNSNRCASVGNTI